MNRRDRKPYTVDNQGGPCMPTNGTNDTPRNESTFGASVMPFVRARPIALGNLPTGVTGERQRPLITLASPAADEARALPIGDDADDYLLRCRVCRRKLGRWRAVFGDPPTVLGLVEIYCKSDRCRQYRLVSIDRSGENQSAA
jgi:hypothetical protein